VYAQKNEPAQLVRVTGQAPLQATVYELERLRCGSCGTVFTAPAPEDVGPDKYDELAGAMIAELKYGTGMPFYRVEHLEQRLGVPLPAATQWEIAEEVADLLKPAGDELIRQAAQGDVVHGDDTGMRVLKLTRPPEDERTGVFTTGVASVAGDRQIAVYFTGRKHAGENVADVLKQRASELPLPVLMCDASASNTSQLDEGVEMLLARCLAHGRRKIVSVAASFPDQCIHVLTELGKVYKADAAAKERKLTPGERLQLHQEPEQAGDGRVVEMDEPAVRRAAGGAELGTGQGDHVLPTALERTHSLSAASGRPTR
jgi:transposase